MVEEKRHPVLIPQQIYQFTSIPRDLNPFLRAHQLIVLLTVVSGVIAGIITLASTGDFGDALVAGLTLGAITFFTWVLAREIEPDLHYAAHLAAVLAFVGGLLIWTPLWDAMPFGGEAPALNGLGWFLLVLLARIVNRSVGYRAKLTDTTLTLLLTGLVVYNGSWLLALVALNAFVLDAWLKPNHPIEWLFALLTPIVTIGALVLRGQNIAEDATLTVVENLILGMGEPATLSGWVAIAITLISTLFFFTLVSIRTINSRADMTDEPMSVRRVHAAMSVALLAGLVTALWGGDAAVLGLLPLWAGLLAVVLYRAPENIARLNAYQTGKPTPDQPKADT